MKRKAALSFVINMLINLISKLVTLPTKIESIQISL